LIRVAFTLIGGAEWIGGRNYLANLLRILATHQAGLIRPLLFVDLTLQPDEVSIFAAIPGVELIQSPALDASRQQRALLGALMCGRDSMLRQEFAAQRVDVVFEAARYFGWRLGIPVIAWMPDFQHRAMPGMFTRASRLKRELGFRAQMHSGRLIMVSSADARAACERYYPGSAGRIFTVRFAVPPVPGLGATTARRVADQYQLPEHFFFMPNQFWRHKNHLLVLEALAKLKDRATPVTVVATGSQVDPRNPGHLQLIQKLVQDRALTDQFRNLGLVPQPHVAALMFCSAALLNPSRYEGWSTTVEEARSMGTPLILSDISVHREQAGANAIYFDPADPAALATVLTDFVPLTAEARNAARVAAQAAAEQRTQTFAEEFLEVVRAAVGATERSLTRPPRT
jgi:glycosyltransferase involved in cell wall biosynthesis